jgi:hypothetical protein
LLGVAAVALNKERLGKHHLKTTHACVGAAFCIVYMLQLCISAWTMWPGRSARDREPSRAVHMVSGVVTFALGLAATYYGWYSRNVQKLGVSRFGASGAWLMNAAIWIGFAALVGGIVLRVRRWQLS